MKNASHSVPNVPGIDRVPFGGPAGGSSVELYTLRNGNRVTVGIMTYGGAIVSLVTPDRRGRLGDVVLGHAALEGYLRWPSYFGALIGRYANRIAKGRFTLDGKTYTLAINDGANHLHGGILGFDKVLWQATPQLASKGPSLRLEYLSRDGEEGYPGNLAASVIYTLTDANELIIEYAATSDQATVVNLTSHSFFNLAGEGSVLDHELQIHAESFTPVDAGLIPTGELRSVNGTPFDFRSAVPIGARIDADDEQLHYGRGYDHNFVLGNEAGKLVSAAEVYEPMTGRSMEVFTTEPGLQLYSGNFLDGSITGRDGRVYGLRSAFCLEAQHYPDSPNQLGFPSAVLRPGETYRQTTIYQFAVR